MDAQRTSSTFPWVGLITLSALIFLTVTSEFLPTGLLPEMARELDVSQGQVGLLITIFAGTVVVSTTPLAALTRRFQRKPLLLAVLMVFVLANVLAAIAPTYTFLMLARVLGGLAHGLFWAIVGAYSGHLVPKNMLGRAVAITSGGGTAAFVLGVPVGTAIGHSIGWRAAFLVIAAAMVLLAFVAVRLLPPVQHIEPLVTGEIVLPLRKDKSIPDIILVCLVVILIMTAHNLFYTFITPFLLGPVGVPLGNIPLVLFLYGS
ncbi:MAG: MFS transporter, partial [Rhodoglobus sp.]|nr:MFS transporter [Rhodoglobus sp.]